MRQRTIRDMHMAIPTRTRRPVTAALVAALVLAGTSTASAGSPSHARSGAATLTPIKHVVVIFQENVSFDHYFATYPSATNPAGEPSFTAQSNTPSVNGLTGALLTANPNAANPQRLDRSRPSPATRITTTPTSRRRSTMA